MTDQKPYEFTLPERTFHTIDLKPTYVADSHVQEKFHAQLSAKNKVDFSNKTRCCCIQRPSWWYHTYPDGSQQIKWLSVASTIALACLVAFLIFLIVIFARYSQQIGEDLSNHEKH
uniref:Uncharacterized protein n=1 Tax=Cacopsylla melanoneura TaxID=428564 RepID=A0A8D8V8D7_9HEMI